MWKNGIHWCMEEGVECIIDDNNAITKSKKNNYSQEWAADLAISLIKP